MLRSRHEAEGGQAIQAQAEPILSLNRAGRELGCDPRIVRGAAIALGIKLREFGTSLVMDHADFERIKERFAAREPGR